MKRFGQVAVAAAALVATARVASAQLPGIPYAPVETGLGVSVSADAGKPNTKAGGGTAFGASVGIGFSRFGISAAAGTRNPSGSGLGLNSSASVGGRIGMKLIGGGLNPISLGVQVGGSTTGDIGGTALNRARLTTIMPGAWVKVSPPLFPFKPWGQVYYLTGSNLPAGTKEARFAVGLNLNLLFGLGVHAAYDWGKTGGSTVGVGAHLNFRVPSLGVPGVPGV